MRFAPLEPRLTFLESLFHTDHDSMRGSAPFDACEEHEPGDATSRKDAMDSHWSAWALFVLRATSLLMRVGLDTLAARLTAV